MNEDGKNFESLRRLLALKRHESPPPGYFDNFSCQVMTRIRAGEAEQAVGWWERMFGEDSWLLRVVQSWQTQPAFAGGLAAALCLLLVSGIIYADRPQATSELAFPAAAGNAGTFVPASSVVMSHPASPAAAPLNSTNPVLSQATAPSLFDQIPLVAQPVSFTPSDN